MAHDDTLETYGIKSYDKVKLNKLLLSQEDEKMKKYFVNMEKKINYRIKILNKEQKIVFDRLLNIINKNKPHQVFIDAAGGSGKTFILEIIEGVYRTLIKINLY